MDEWFPEGATRRCKAQEEGPTYTQQVVEEGTLPDSSNDSNAWRSIYSERESMARQPPLSFTYVHQWQQQSLTETFASYFPEKVFDGFNFPYIEDLVNLPAFNRYADWLPDARDHLPK